MRFHDGNILVVGITILLWARLGSAWEFSRLNVGLERGNVYESVLLRSRDEAQALEPREVNLTRLRGLPECAGQCLDDVVGRYGCTFDGACLCDNGNLTASLDACLGSNCTLADGLAAQRFRADTCDKPVRDRGPLTRNLNWAMFAIATLFVFGRFLSRTPYLGGSGYWWDDYSVLFCYVLLIPTDVTAELEVRQGLGKDMYMLSLENIVNVLQLFYLGELFYNVIVMMTKISLVLLYLRIWKADSVTSAFRITCWVIIGILTAAWIAGASVIIFQCTPAFTYAYGALNICFDVVVFFLPMHSLLKLKIPWRKKVGVCSVFLVGFLVTICSIVRLQYLVRLQATQNISWDFQYIGMWSLVEANFSTVCCCMPAMAGLAQRVWMKTHSLTNFGSSDGRSRGGQEKMFTDEHSGNSWPRHDSNPNGAAAHTETALQKGQQTPQPDEESTTAEQGNSPTPISASTAAEALRKDRHRDSRDRPSSAIMYRPRGSGQSHYVEIAHEPPTELSTTKLSYRDHNDILHEIELIDRPLGRVPGHSSNSGASRAQQWRAMRQVIDEPEDADDGPGGSPSPGSGGFATNSTPRLGCTLFGGGV